MLDYEVLESLMSTLLPCRQCPRTLLLEFDTFGNRGDGGRLRMINANRCRTHVMK